MPGRKEKPPRDPLVLVATAPNEPLASMWAGILENEGIHSVIRGQELTAAMYVPSGLTPCRVFVLSSQADKAKEVLKPFLEDE
jgi:hypothetical protein